MSACALQAQDLNNDAPLDSLDLRNALHLLQVNTFKFPVKSPVKGQDFMMNFVLEEYRDAKRTVSVSILDTIKSRLPAFVSLARAYSKSMVGDASRFVRFYTYRRSDTELVLAYGFDDNIQQVTFELDTSKIGPSGSRAMDFDGLAVDERVPLVVFYANRRGESLLKCPADASVSDIAERYAYVIVLYGELRQD